MKLNRLMAALTFVAAGVGAASAVAAVDPALPNYEKTSGVSGNLSSVGSDSLANLMTLWAEEFKRSYPNVNIQIQAAGSSTAPPALTEGTANMGPMSRPMKDNEIQAFEEKYGYQALGRPGPAGRVGSQADPAVRSQLGIRHLRLLQGRSSVQG